MIKLKKIVAVAMATTMIMGLSMTASAMNIASPWINPDGAGSDEATADGQLIKGAPTIWDTEDPDVALKEGAVEVDQIQASSDTATSVATTKKLAAVLEENDASIPKGASVVPLYAANVTKVPEDGAVLKFALSDFDAAGEDFTAYREGDTVYALVETQQGSGIWELQDGTVNDKGEVEFTVDHKGGFVLFKTISDKDDRVIKLTYKAPGQLDPDNPPVIIDPDQPQQPQQPVGPNQPGTSTNPSNGQNANGAANANGSTWTSPKTGEF